MAAGPQELAVESAELGRRERAEAQMADPGNDPLPQRVLVARGGRGPQARPNGSQPVFEILATVWRPGPPTSPSGPAREPQSVRPRPPAGCGTRRPISA